MCIAAIALTWTVTALTALSGSGARRLLGNCAAVPQSSVACHVYVYIDIFIYIYIYMSKTDLKPTSKATGHEQRLQQ